METKDFRIKHYKNHLKGWANLDEYQIEEKGNGQTYNRYVFDNGNGAAVLLINQKEKTVVLTRQFRLPAFVNSHETGYVIEACAGLVDENDPADTVRREAIEETGYKIDRLEFVADVFATPGAKTERLYLFIGFITTEGKIGNGGGLDAENEDIEVLSFTFAEIIEMHNSKSFEDAKTLMCVQYAMLKGYLS